MTKRARAALVVAAFLLPARADAATCKASFYHEGQMTANGERFKPDGLTAAIWGYPFGTLLRVNFKDRSVVVRINDRGPAKWTGRCIDLSRGAARILGFLSAGVVTVTFEKA